MDTGKRLDAVMIALAENMRALENTRIAVPPLSQEIARQSRVPDAEATRRIRDLKRLINDLKRRNGGNKN